MDFQQSRHHILYSTTNDPKTEVKTEQIQKPEEPMKSATKTGQKLPERPKKSELA